MNFIKKKFFRVALPRFGSFRLHTPAPLRAVGACGCGLVRVSVVLRSYGCPNTSAQMPRTCQKMSLSNFWTFVQFLNNPPSHLLNFLIIPCSVCAATTRAEFLKFFNNFLRIFNKSVRVWVVVRVWVGIVSAYTFRLDHKQKQLKKYAKYFVY